VGRLFDMPALPAPLSSGTTPLTPPERSAPQTSPAKGVKETGSLLTPQQLLPLLRVTLAGLGERAAAIAVWWCALGCTVARASYQSWQLLALRVRPAA
jgi:hypothetical protein